MMRALFLLIVVCTVLAAASYAGVRATAGKLTGPNPQGLGSATTRFSFEGIPALRGKPRGWVVRYSQARGFGGAAEIYVSPTGRLLGTRPANLGQQLEAQREEQP